MKQLNRYYRYAKISERKTRQIIKFYAVDLTVYRVGSLTGLNRKSVNQIFLKIRRCIAQEAERASLSRKLKSRLMNLILEVLRAVKD